MRTNWADHVAIHIDGETLENIYTERNALKRELSKLREAKTKQAEQLVEQGKIISNLKQEVQAKEEEISQLLSLIDNLRDDLREATFKSQPSFQYFYGG